MATFPALRPAGRRYNLGAFPITNEIGNVRFLHGSALVGFSIELAFTDLTQAEAALIRNHYRIQQGGYISFRLSDEAWAGNSSIFDLFPPSTAWRYSDIPEETQKTGGYVDMTVQLESVRDESTPNLRVRISLTPGAATA